MLIVLEYEMDKLRVSIKITQPIIYALLLIGCADSIQSTEPAQDKTITKLTPNSIPWHDGSKGGDYGIGEGWSIEILPAEFETVLDAVTLGHPADTSLIHTPAEYEWIRDESEDLTGEPTMVSELITIPAKYMTITETVVVKPEHTGYYLTDATYTAYGSIITPKTVKQKVIPAEVRQEERRVMKTPERLIHRMVPLERRKGYRRVVKTPSSFNDRPWFIGPYYTPRIVETQPWRFLIKKPNDGIVHVFDDINDLTTFMDSLK